MIIEDDYLLNKKELVKVVLISTYEVYLLGIRKFLYYSFSSHNDGEYIVYKGKKSFAYLSIVDDEFKPAMTELLSLANERSLNINNLIHNAIFIGTSGALSLEPRPHRSYLLPFDERSLQTQQITFNYLDFNKIWFDLSNRNRERIMSKTRQDQKFNFLRGILR